MIPNLPKALIFDIKIKVFLYINILKNFANFYNQKIKIKGGMQVTVMFQKWNHFWRMADIYVFCN